MTFPLTGSITVQLPVELFDRWLACPAHWGEGIEVLTATREIRITGAVSATIGAVPMQPYESGRLGLRFEGPAGQEFELDIRERKGWLVRLVPGSQDKGTRGQGDKETFSLSPHLLVSLS
jgi:hypothetical protein